MEKEPSKEALEFAKTVVETKAIAGIVIVGSIVMDVHGGIPQTLQGGREWERNIAVIVEQYVQAKFPPMPPCYRCNGTGSITHFGEGADDGHDIDLNCPVCNPKYGRDDDDRDWYNDY